jgi:signal transduction histidine kinase
MTVRFKIALTIFATGLATALCVILTVAVAFQRFEHESAYDRANAFLSRVVSQYDNIFDLHERHPEEFTPWLRNLVLFETDTQLYLLSADGTVLASTGEVRLPPGFKVALGPVKEAITGVDGRARMPYVMGDDPERMSTDAVIAARPLRRALIRGNEPVAGYLYLVCHKPALPPGRLEVFRSAFATPAMLAVACVVLLATVLAAWIIAAVTRPLRQLSAEVAAISRDGLGVAPPAEGAFAPDPLPATVMTARDEFGQLREGFRAMLATLRMQWEALRRLDHFRREGVSNLSHDLRSPLTATVACLETLEQRWTGEAGREEDRRLVEVALRNTRNAAQLVRSLGDLAQLDEPEFKLNAQVMDVDELLDDIALRFAERAAQQGVTVACEAPAASAQPLARLPPFAALDIELFERAVANLVDNALKFTPAGGRIVLSACLAPTPAGPAEAPYCVQVTVQDSGTGIPAEDVGHLFDRFYQSRHSVAPATGEGGKGLGLAIVKRIAELHGGSVSVASTVGVGTRVTLSLPAVTM